MALASQMTRSDRTGGSWGASRGRRRGPGGRGAAVVLLVGVAAIGLGLWGLTRLRAGRTAEIAGTTAAVPAASGTFEAASALPTSGQVVPQAPVGGGATDMTLAAAGHAARDVLASQAGGTVDAPATPAQPVVTPVSAPAPDPKPRPTEPVTQPPPTVASAPSSTGTLPSDLQASLTAADRAWKENRLVEARTLLNRALLDPRTGEADRAAIRAQISELNKTLVFSPAVLKADPLAETYTIKSGDALARITQRMGLAVDWRLIQRINHISNPSRISVGQKIKLLRGPFHAVVDKSEFRMDVYAGDPVSASAGRPTRADGVEPGWIYIRSFRVGLGEHGTTPIGTFVVRQNSKLINPFWKNPRTGEEFAADDPKNPIGEHWLGLDGLDEATKAFQGYGVHGTIDPESIGKEMSMGCVRLAPADIALVYEMLEEGVSIVRIVP